MDWRDIRLYKERFQKIEKYYWDYYGSISVVPISSTKNIKVTNVVTKETNYIPSIISRNNLEHDIYNIFADF